MSPKWDDSTRVRRRREAATAMSHQADRLERRLPRVLSDTEARLGNVRYAQVVWGIAAKQVDFGHLVAAGYRTGRFTAIASLVRTLFEDLTLLAWMALPDDPNNQASRVRRTLLQFYREAVNKGGAIPPDGAGLLKVTTGKEARKPPSWEARVAQLEADEGAKPGGKGFWTSHIAHVEMLNDYVHSNLSGTGQFIGPIWRELLGFEALVYGNEYLLGSIIGVARLAGQDELAHRARAAYDRTHDGDMAELERLMTEASSAA